jgi:hypothetical protein
MLDEREEEAKRRAHLIRNETRTRGMCKLEDNEKKFIRFNIYIV